MTDLTTFLDKNGKSAVYTGVNIHGTYRYLQMIGSPTTLTTSSQRSHHYGTSYSINNYTSSIQTVIAVLLTRQNTICKHCGMIGHKSDTCTICGPKSFPPSLIRNKIGSTPFMVKNKMIHQKIGTANLQ